VWAFYLYHSPIKNVDNVKEAAHHLAESAWDLHSADQRQACNISK
jgi:uncharacterized protein YpmB